MLTSCCSRLRLQKVISSISNLHICSCIWCFNGCFSSIKKINRLISKGMSFTIEKIWRSQNFDFLRKKIWRNALALKSKKIQGIIGETFALSSPAVCWLQNCVYVASFIMELKMINAFRPKMVARLPKKMCTQMKTKIYCHTNKQ